MAQAPAKEKNQGVQVARICEKAPAFDCVALLPDGSFKNLKLSDFKDEWLVLFFYPLDFTFVCPTEIIEFSDKSEEFEQIGCKVVGSSVDSQFTHLAWTDTPRKKGGLGKMNIPLLGDVNRHVAKSYGVLLNDVGHTCRGTFIIDNKGIIRHMSMNDPPVGRNVDEVLRLVKGYQFADKNGEVCPAKWQPSGDNKATIKPDPKAKMEYFEQANK